MKRWSLGESSLLSGEVVVFTLFLLPICGIALRQIIKVKHESDPNDSCENTQAIFNSAINRFKTFIEVKDENIIGDDSISISIDKTVDYSHQVAGHTCEVLRGFQGKVLKPMVKGRLFIRELRLYEQMAQSPCLSSGLPKSFVPNYIGLALVQNIRSGLQDGNDLRRNSFLSSILNMFSRLFLLPSEIDCINHYLVKKQLPHLVLDDLTLNYVAPCVIDIKMGQQTYEPNANSSKIKREIRKCPYQVTTGFRITGMKVYDITNATYSCKDKQFGRSVTPDGAMEALRTFFWNGVSVRNDVIISVVQQLNVILLWFENQSSLHFYCSSILIIYDGCTNNIDKNANNKTIPTDLVKVKMIDFAHTLPSPYPKDIDHGYVLGIRNLISKLNEIVNQ